MKQMINKVFSSEKVLLILCIGMYIMGCMIEPLI